MKKVITVLLFALACTLQAQTNYAPVNVIDTSRSDRLKRMVEIRAKARSVEAGSYAGIKYAEAVKEMTGDGGIEAVSNKVAGVDTVVEAAK